MSGSNIGSSRSSAGVSGTREASAPSDGIDNSFCNAAMVRFGSPICAATRANTSIRSGAIHYVFLEQQHFHRPF